MAAIRISTNVEFLQINTATRAGTILLPSTTALAGRILTVKDTTGSFFQNPLTLSTNGPDRFESGDNLKRLIEPYGSLTLASDGANRWLFLDGTSLNSYTFSTLTNTLQTSTFNISSQQTTVSTFNMIDRSFRTTSTVYTRSTILYLGSNPIAGTKASPQQIFAPLTGGFQPNQVPGLLAWYDSADTTTYLRSNGVFLGLLDKSGNGNNAFQIVPAKRPTVSSNALNGKNASFFLRASALYFSTTLTMDTQNHSLFVLNKTDNTGDASKANQMCWMTAANGLGIVFGNYNYSLNVYTGYTNAYSSGTTASGLNDNPVYFTTWNFGEALISNNTQTIYRWGSQTATAANPITSQTTPGTLLLGWNGGIYYFGGLTGEILVYNSSVMTSHRQQIEGYMAWKWAQVAQLPLSHPYKRAPP